MKKMRKLFCLLLALCMVFALCACGRSTAGEKKTFIMGIDPEYPPFSYLGDDGSYTGFDVEVCRAVCDSLGWELQIFPVNWEEKLIQLDANECDCVWSGMTILDTMKDAGYVISAPYYDNSQVLVVKADSGLDSSSDLAGKIVAVQLGTSGEALLNDDLADLASTFGSILTCDSFLKCFTELEGGAVDAVFVDLPRHCLPLLRRRAVRPGGGGGGQAGRRRHLREDRLQERVCRDRQQSALPEQRLITPPEHHRDPLHTPPRGRAASPGTFLIKEEPLCRF